MRALAAICISALILLAAAGPAAAQGPPASASYVRSGSGPARIGLELEATISTGERPVAIAVDPGTRKAFVANAADGSVAVVALTSGRTIARIPVGAAPSAIAVNPLTSKVYVALAGEHHVAVLSAVSHAVIGRIRVGIEPAGIAIDAESNTILVANRGSNTISVIDGTQDRVEREIEDGIRPTAIAVHPTALRAYVAASSPSLTVIDTRFHTVLRPVSAAPNPVALAIDPRTGTVFVASQGAEGLLAVVDLEKLATLPVGPRPACVALDVARNLAYVGDAEVGTIHIVDISTRRVLGIAQVGSGVAGLAVADGKLYAALPGWNAIVALRRVELAPGAAAGATGGKDGDGPSLLEAALAPLGASAWFVQGLHGSISARHESSFSRSAAGTREGRSSSGTLSLSRAGELAGGNLRYQANGGFDFGVSRFGPGGDQEAWNAVWMVNAQALPKSQLPMSFVTSRQIVSLVSGGRGFRGTADAHGARIGLLPAILGSSHASYGYSEARIEDGEGATGRPPTHEFGAYLERRFGDDLFASGTYRGLLVPELHREAHSGSAGARIRLAPDLHVGASGGFATEAGRDAYEGHGALDWRPDLLTTFSARADHAERELDQGRSSVDAGGVGFNRQLDARWTVGVELSGGVGSTRTRDADVDSRSGAGRAGASYRRPIGPFQASAGLASGVAVAETDQGDERLSLPSVASFGLGHLTFGQLTTLAGIEAIWLERRDGAEEEALRQRYEARYGNQIERFTVLAGVTRERSYVTGETPARTAWTAALLARVYEHRWESARFTSSAGYTFARSNSSTTHGAVGAAGLEWRPIPSLGIAANHATEYQLGPADQQRFHSGLDGRATWRYRQIQVAAWCRIDHTTTDFDEKTADQLTVGIEFRRDF